MQIRSALLGCAILAALGGVGEAAATPFSAIYAFGDSLSDAGNDFLATGGAIPASPPYFNGHFSNGLTWVEDLSQGLGLGPLRPSLAGGTDFAFGGATTGAVPGPPLIAGAPTISAEIGMFMAANGGVAPAHGLYTVWAGANDVFLALDGISGGTLTVPVAASDLGQAAKITAGAVHSLASAGARTFLVPLIPNIGRTPAVNGNPGVAALAAQLSQSYNADLVGDVGALIGSDHITVRFLDVFSLLEAAVADPAAFGFNDVTDPCYPGPFTGGVPACPNPDSFLFWDFIHPTEPGHEAIARLAEAAIPEPPMIGVLAMLCVALAARRGALSARRRARSAERASSAEPEPLLA